MKSHALKCIAAVAFAAALACIEPFMPMGAAFAANSSAIGDGGLRNPNRQPAVDIVWGAVDYETDLATYQERLDYYGQQILEARRRADQSATAFDLKVGVKGTIIRSDFDRWNRRHPSAISDDKLQEYGAQTQAAYQDYQKIRASLPDAVADRPEDPDVRRKLWTAHLNHLRRTLQEHTARAVRNEEVLTQTERYFNGWYTTFINEFVYGAMDDIAHVLGRTADSVVDTAISKCVHELIYKMGNDLAFSRAFGAPFADAGSRIKGCVVDVGKDLLVKAWESAFEAWFLRKVREGRVPQEIGEFWWNEFILAEAPKKEGFLEAIRSETDKWAQKSAGQVALQLSKKWIEAGYNEKIARDVINAKGAEKLAAEWAEEHRAWRERVARLVRNEGQALGDNGTLLRQRVVDSRQLRAQALEAIGNDQSLRESVREKVKEDIDSAQTANKALQIVDAADLLINLSERYLLVTFNWADFNMANAIGQYHRVVDCLKAQGKSTDVATVKAHLRRFQSGGSLAPAANSGSGNDLHDYTAFLRSCKPERQEKLEARIMEAEEIRDSLDPDSLPRDLPARLKALEDRIYGFETGPVKDAVRRVDLVIDGFKSMCGWNETEWSMLRERLTKTRIAHATLNELGSRTTEQTAKVCSAGDYSAAKIAASDLSRFGDEAKRQFDTVEWESDQLGREAEDVEPIDFDALLSTHSGLRGEADALIAEIDATRTKKADMLAETDRGIGLVAALFEPRAEALESALRAIRARIVSVEIPDHHWRIDDLPEILSTLQSNKSKQDKATACAADLPKPDLATMSEEATRLKDEAGKQAKLVEAKQAEAEQCIEPLKQAVIAEARNKIEACKFAEADRIIEQLPVTDTDRGNLRSESASRSSSDSGDRATLSVNMNLMETGNVNNALESLKRALPDVDCPETREKFEAAISMMGRIANAAAKIRADIKACNFIAAEQGIIGFTTPDALKSKLDGELQETKARDEAALQKAQAVAAEYDASGVRAKADITEMTFKRDEAQCPETKAKIQALIDAATKTSEDKLAAARQALARCDHARAEQIIGINPRGEPARQLLEKVRAGAKADRAARRSLIDAKSAFTGGKYKAARPLAQSAANEKLACEETQREARTLLSSIAKAEDDRRRQEGTQSAMQVCGMVKPGSRPKFKSKDYKQFDCDCGSLKDIGSKCVKDTQSASNSQAQSAAAQICGNKKVQFLPNGNFKCVDGGSTGSRPTGPVSAPAGGGTRTALTPTSPTQPSGQAPTTSGAGSDPRCTYYSRKAAAYSQESQRLLRQVRSAPPNQQTYLQQKLSNLSMCTAQVTQMGEKDGCPGFRVSDSARASMPQWQAQMAQHGARCTDRISPPPRTASGGGGNSYSKCQCRDERGRPYYQGFGLPCGTTASARDYDCGS